MVHKRKTRQRAMLAGFLKTDTAIGVAAEQWSKSDVSNLTTKAIENQALCGKIASPFAAAFAELAAAGYSVIPIKPGEKAPIPNMWQSYAENPASPARLMAWSRVDGAGIGTVLGSRVGDYIVVAVDIDATGDALDTIASSLASSTMCKVGAKGETRFFRASPDIKTKQYRDGAGNVLVDVLAKGRQTVVPPSIHPNTACPYVWLASPVSAADLPILTKDDLERLEDTLGALGWAGDREVADDTETVAQHDPASAADLDPMTFVNRKLNDHALANLRAWVPSLGLYNLRKTAGGFEAVATWRESSTGQPLEHRKRNLSIHRNGIADFGCGDKFTAIDLTMRALGCSQNEAFQYLYDCTDAEAMFAEGCTINFRALTENEERKRLARLAEREEEMKATSALCEVESGLPRANDNLPLHDPETGEIYEAHDPSARELPAHLCRPPGLFGRIVEWVYSTAGNPNSALALATGVAVMAVLIGKGRSTPIRAGGVHLYTLVIGPTACGKGHALKCARKLITAASAPSTPFQPALELIGDDDWMSQSALLNQLVDKPVSLSLTDEIGAFLSTAMARNAGAHLTNLLKTVRTAWSCSLDDSFTTPGWANKKAIVVSPCFSVLGATTAPEFFAALSSKETVNGVLNRFLAIQTWEKGSSLISETDDDEDGELAVPFELADDLIRFARLMRGSQRFIKTPWADGGPRAYNDMVAKIDDMIAKDSSLEPYLGRCAEMAMKLATISAVGRDPFSPAVTVEDVKFGQGIAEWSLLAMAEGAGDYIGDSQVEKDRNAIIRALKAAKGGVMTRSQLLRRGLSAKCVMETTRELKEMGVIAISETSQAKGPVAKTYRLLAQARRN